MFYSANAETTRVQKKCHLKKLKKFLFYEASVPNFQELWNKIKNAKEL